MAGFKYIDRLACGFDRFFAITEFDIARGDLLITAGDLDNFFLGFKD